MNVVSKIIGIIALIIMLIGLIPLFGILNWIVLPLASLGVVIGIFAPNKSGFTLNAIVLIISALRLMVGGGII